MHPHDHGTTPSAHPSSEAGRKGTRESPGERRIASPVEAIARITGNPINYWAGFVVDIAGVALFLTLGLRAGGANSLARFTVVALGYCGWTLFEYNVHRFLFHGEWSPLAPGHLAHHAAPRRTIGMPFFVAFGIAATLFAVCWLAMPMPYPYFFVAGAYLGWLCYGILHHVEHVADLSLRPYRSLRRHHLAHHRAMSTNFGVSTTSWDRLFGTHLGRRGR